MKPTEHDPAYAPLDTPWDLLATPEGALTPEEKREIKRRSPQLSEEELVELRRHLCPE